MEAHNGGYKHTCEDCGQEYANRRNLKRHRNQRHDEKVKFLRCSISECRRYFFRREYLILHLGCVHKMDSTSAKKIGKDVYTEFGKREELEFENKRFRTDPETSEEAVQDTAVTETANNPGSSPDVSGISDINPGYNLDYLELFADSTEFDEEFIINEVCEEIFESIVEMLPVQTCLSQFLVHRDCAKTKSIMKDVSLIQKMIVKLMLGYMIDYMNMQVEISQHSTSKLLRHYP